MLLKIVGIILMVLALLALGIFPGRLYQRSAMMKTGVWFGVLLFLIGIALAVFG